MKLIDFVTKVNGSFAKVSIYYEIAQMIADVDDADLPTWCVTSIITESYLFSK